MNLWERLTSRCRSMGVDLERHRALANLWGAIENRRQRTRCSVGRRLMRDRELSTRAAVTLSAAIPPITTPRFSGGCGNCYG
jgi:hypothetical protein